MKKNIPVPKPVICAHLFCQILNIKSCMICFALRVYQTVNNAAWWLPAVEVLTDLCVSVSVQPPLTPIPLPPASK